MPEKDNYDQEHAFALNGEGRTRFLSKDGSVQLASLFGLTCKLDETGSGIAPVQNLLNVATDIGCSDMAGHITTACGYSSDSLEYLWNMPSAGMEAKSRWAFCAKTGIWSRKDSITNVTIHQATLLRCLSRFAFAPSRYEVYSQGSRWCNENEGKWQELRHGSLILACENGRTTQGGTPFVCIRNKNTGKGVVFHVVPKGNWTIKISAKTAPGSSLPYAVLEMGLADENLHLSMEPGQSIELPEIFIQELLSGEPRFSAPRLHRYLLMREGKCSEYGAPVVYNTWFDAFDYLDTGRLQQQLVAAKSIGCEVFTVDAGWYGSQKGDWFAQAGDWSEKIDGAFHGHMHEFAEEVRAAGLGFGLWMEPERIGPQAPILKQHPEWFRAAGNGYFYANLRQKEAYDYVKREMFRLVDAYHLAWMKLDFNFNLGIDLDGSEFFWYYEAWYRLLDELKLKYADVFIEGCASGGMRLEISMLSHCDAHFLSDTVDPLDILNISSGALLRLPPGRLSKWAVLRSLSNCIPKYGAPLHESPDTLVAPAGATWEVSKTVNIDFTVITAMTGVLGFSGDIAGLSEAIQNRLRLHIEFYKANRKSIYNSIGYLLTTLNNGNEQWNAIQLQSCQSTESILFIYRLDDAYRTNNFIPLALDEKMLYQIEYWDGREKIQQIHGAKLMEDGITVVISDRYDATAVIIRPI